MKGYAKHAFSNDHDQEIAFTQNVTVFVQKLNDKCAIAQNYSRKRNHHSILMNQHTNESIESMKNLLMTNSLSASYQKLKEQRSQKSYIHSAMTVRTFANSN